jgi:hypothetical protein
MRSTLISCVTLGASLVTLSSLASAQEELYYKFDRGVGTVAVNYGTAPVASEVINAGGSGPWAAVGQAGGSLEGSPSNSATHYNYCNTGWTAAHTGSFTVHWWMKERYVPPSTSYFFSGIGSFRCFTGGAANQDLLLRAWGGAPADIRMPLVGASLQTRAKAANGVTVSLVVDGTALSAQWYVDGLPHGTAIALTSAAPLPNPSSLPLLIGKHTSNSSTSAYDIDEFRFASRAASAVEIRTWHNAPSAASGSFGPTNCGITLTTSGGAPTEGNANHAYNIAGPANLQFLLVVGVQPQPGFDMGIAFPGLKGCIFYPQFLVQVVGAAPNGAAVIPTPIPLGTAGVGVELQILGFDASKQYMSNAVSTKIEK